MQLAIYNSIHVIAAYFSVPGKICTMEEVERMVNWSKSADLIEFWSSPIIDAYYRALPQETKDFFLDMYQEYYPGPCRLMRSA